MSLRMIPTSVHGAIDYLTGGALLAAPKVLGLTDEPRAALVLRSAGTSWSGRWRCWPRRAPRPSRQGKSAHGGPVANWAVFRVPTR
jgi:hypothetical protein